MVLSDTNSWTVPLASAGLIKNTARTCPGANLSEAAHAPTVQQLFYTLPYHARVSRKPRVMTLSSFHWRGRIRVCPSQVTVQASPPLIIGDGRPDSRMSVFASFFSLPFLFPAPSQKTGRGARRGAGAVPGAERRGGGRLAVPTRRGAGSRGRVCVPHGGCGGTRDSWHRQAGRSRLWDGMLASSWWIAAWCTVYVRSIVRSPHPCLYVVYWTICPLEMDVSIPFVMREMNTEGYLEKEQEIHWNM